MLNIKSGTILANGLGGPALQMLILGPLNLYISQVPTTPPVTPPVTPPYVRRPGGGGTVYDPDYDLVYKITLITKITSRKTIQKEFIVDKRVKDIVVRRIGNINMMIHKFESIFIRLKQDITTRWKK